MRRRQPQVANAEGKVKRVAEYIQDEFPVPRGRPSGHMLLKEDRKLAAIVLSVAQAVWFITIAVGIILYAGKSCCMDAEMDAEYTSTASKSICSAACLVSWVCINHRVELWQICLSCTVSIAWHSASSF